MPGRVESWTTMRGRPSEEARMRGEGTGSEPHMWSYVPLEQRIPADHPLRALQAMVDTILSELSPQFDQLYSKVGRPSIPPEHLLRALLLQVLYSVRSERLLMEQLDYNLLFRWFVGLAMDDPIWDATVFTKNRERLLRGDIAQAFFERVRAQAEQRGLLSDEHFAFRPPTAGGRSQRTRFASPGRCPWMRRGPQLCASHLLFPQPARRRNPHAHWTTDSAADPQRR